MEKDMVVIIPSEIFSGYVGEHSRYKTKKIVHEEFWMSESSWYTILKTWVCSLVCIKRMFKNENFKKYLENKGMVVDITELF